MILEDRTLKGFICPSLAATDIFLRMGSKKIGSFFCCLESFDKIVAQAKSPKMEEIMFRDFAEQEALLDEAAVMFRKNQVFIKSFTWNLTYFIRQIPRKLWMT